MIKPLGTIVDIHTHAFNEQLAPRVIAELEAMSEIKAHLDGTVTGLLKSMESAGITQSIIQPVASKVRQVEPINHWCKNIMIPGQLNSFATLHPDMSFQELEKEIYFVKEQGFKGVKMHSEYQSFFPDDSRLTKIYELLTKYGLILLLHSGRDLCFSGEVKATPKRLLQVHKGFPGLTMILAHLGGFQMWDEVEKELAGMPVWLDTAYCAGYCPLEQFEGITQAHGSERILFGSDAPWGEQKKHLDYIMSTKLTEEEKHRILGKNTIQLLGESNQGKSE